MFLVYTVANNFHQCGILKPFSLHTDFDKAQCGCSFHKICVKAKVSEGKPYV